MLMPFLFLSLLSFACFIEGKFFTKIKTDVDGGVRAYAYKEETAENENDGSPICTAYYKNSYLDVGWDIMEVQTNPANQTDLEQVQCAGFLEGYLTVNATYINYYNTVKQWCKGRKQTCAKIHKFIGKHFRWINKSIKRRANRDPIWHHVNMFYSHILALQQSYAETQTDPKKALTLTDFIMMNLQPDLSDVAAAIEGDVTATVKGNFYGSAIVKLLPNNEDLLVGHNTWTEYNQMYRMLKKYDMPLRRSNASLLTVPGSVISFSGYPGVITSRDDFYVTNSGLVATETTIGNNNASWWKYVKPTGQLFESVRSLIALRLANNGSSWCEIFSGYNSGTYNNQWMIVDFKQFKKGNQPGDGTLWVVEQIPGYIIRYEDQTYILPYQTYWPSYNIPYYYDVFLLSGNEQLVHKYGNWFSYIYAPRAQIFQRDHSNVTDLNSLMTLMRSNNYKNDQYAKCNCTAGYSAENGIAARSDLNPKKGFPYAALGHRPHGAIDAKVISSLLVNNQTFVAVCGPSTGTGSELPPFRWDTSGFKHVPHMGQPNSFNFHPMITPWRGPFF